ncbi:hypothetical protein HDV03_005077 [Kappamyces sp. JEL0829]|nr:hypothetical protein HDV03_005077 [Kappamyces sp. JEL0829]
MTLDLIAVESIIQKEEEFQYANPTLVLDYPVLQKGGNYSRLKRQFLESRHEAEYIKAVGEFDFGKRSKAQVDEATQLASQAKDDTRAKKQDIQDFKVSLLGLASDIAQDYEAMIREKDDMIECLAKCRELDEEYERIFVASQQLDQNPVLQELEKEKALEELEMARLEEELQEAAQAFELSQQRLEQVQSGLPLLEQLTAEAVERETEAIRISNAKDPQVEELGKWYKETLRLLYGMLDITNLTLCSDTKIQVEYFEGAYIINFVLNPAAAKESGQPVYIEMVKGSLQYQDILDSSTEFATMNLALAHIVNQLSIRMHANLARDQEIQSLAASCGATFESSSDELLIPSLTSSRCFLFKLDPIYPIGGMSSAKLLLIEVAEEEESLAEWNAKLAGYNSITDVVSLLI